MRAINMCTQTFPMIVCIFHFTSPCHSRDICGRFFGALYDFLDKIRKSGKLTFCLVGYLVNYLFSNTGSSKIPSTVKWFLFSGLDISNYFKAMWRKIEVWRQNYWVISQSNYKVWFKTIHVITHFFCTDRYLIFFFQFLFSCC